MIYALLIPFLGTVLGSACVFFMRGKLNEKVERALNGFAAGVMVAASIWSLLQPAIEEESDRGRFAFLPAFIGFWLGILFLLLLDHIIPHLHQFTDEAEGPKSKLQRSTMMVLARGNGRRRRLCRCSLRELPHFNGGSYVSGRRHCHSELPGGRHHLDAAPCGGEK